MKKIGLYLMIVLSFSSCLNSLEDEGVFTETITFKGRVVDDGVLAPIEGMRVQITNGDIIKEQIITSEDGIFELSVKLTDIDNSYYLLLTGMDQYSEKKGKLFGFGKEEYDFGNLYFTNNRSFLPEVEYNGTTYMIAPKFESGMNWNAAMNACANLTYVDYSDWELPSKEVLNMMYLFKNEIEGFSSHSYWSSTEYNSTFAWYLDEDGNVMHGDMPYGYSYTKEHFRYVRCVRKVN